MCTCCFYLWCPAVWREWAGFPCLGALMNFHLLVLRTGPEGQHSKSSIPLRPDFLLNSILLVLMVLQQSAIQHMHHHRCVFFFFFYRSQMRKKVCKDSHLTTWLLCGSSQSSLSVHTFGLTQHWSIQLLTKSAGGSWSNEQETRLCALNGDWRINSHFCGTIRNRLD